VRLLAVLDKKCHAHPASPWYTYKIFILCRETGGKLQVGMETLDARFFAADKLPPLSVDRITENQIKLMFQFLENPDKVAVCD
jgi:hypothetical protein